MPTHMKYCIYITSIGGGSNLERRHCKRSRAADDAPINASSLSISICLYRYIYIYIHIYIYRNMDTSI